VPIPYGNSGHQWVNNVSSLTAVAVGSRLRRLHLVNVQLKRNTFVFHFLKLIAHCSTSEGDFAGHVVMIMPNTHRGTNLLTISERVSSSRIDLSDLS